MLRFGAGDLHRGPSYGNVGDKNVCFESKADAMAQFALVLSGPGRIANVLQPCARPHPAKKGEIQLDCGGNLRCCLLGRCFRSTQSNTLRNWARIKITEGEGS